MSTLTSTDSKTTLSTMDKKLEEGHGHTVPVNTLAAIIEDGELDEGAKIVGDVAHNITQEEDDAVRRKLDMRILPILAFVYFSQFLDKLAPSYASVLSLPITGESYNLVSLAFYVGFFVAEIPQGIISQRFPLARYLGSNILLWATALILHAASGRFAPFFIFRVLLGVFEACVAPILIALIASFYKKSEQARRIGFYYAMNGVTYIVGGAIAYGVTHYHGDAIAHWRIIFILFGGLAFVAGTIVILFLPSSPATAPFLTEREKVIALERVRSGQSGTISHVWKKAQGTEALKDVKTWLVFLLMITVSVPNAAITSFQSILVKSFGYTSAEALLMNMPCGAMQISATLAATYWADKRKARMFPFIATLIPSIVGFALLVSFSGSTSHNKAHKGPLLAGIVLSQTFITSIALLYSWSSSNVAGSSKRSVVNALMLVAFSMGNVAGTQAFQAKDAPRYLPGKTALLVLLCALVPIALVLHFYTRLLNSRKEQAVRELVEVNGWSDEELQKEKDRCAFLDATDLQNPFFVYTC
ncbi:hypothetical protein JCM10295v2_003631 [Rhodotorula toruloides]